MIELRRLEWRYFFDGETQMVRATDAEAENIPRSPSRPGGTAKPFSVRLHAKQLARLGDLAKNDPAIPSIGKAIELAIDQFLAPKTAIDVDTRFEKLRRRILQLSKNRKRYNVTMLLFSGDEIPDLRDDLLEKTDSQIELFVQHPATVARYNVRQARKIIQLLQDLPERSRSFLSNGRLKRYFYTSPATIHGILIEDVLVAIGWYTYSNSEGSVKSTSIEVMGHRNPIVFAENGAPGFENLRAFFEIQVESIRKIKQSIPIQNAKLEQLLKKIERDHGKQSGGKRIWPSGIHQPD